MTDLHPQPIAVSASSGEHHPCPLGGSASRPLNLAPPPDGRSDVASAIARVRPAVSGWTSEDERRADLEHDYARGWCDTEELS